VVGDAVDVGAKAFALDSETEPMFPHFFCFT
jgi:hypothetical protein